MAELGRKIGFGQPPFIITTKDSRELGTLADALAAIDAAAAAGCDAIKLGASPQRPIPWAWCASAFQRAHDRGVVLLARPDDEYAISQYDWLGAVAFEIAFDISDLDTVAVAARTGKPIVLTVGAASDCELGEIVELVGADNLVLVLPVCDLDDLARIDRLAKHGCALGVTDVHADSRFALAAIARGASVVELRRGDRLALARTIRHCDLSHPAAWATN